MELEGFSERLMRYLDHIEYRRVETSEDLEAVEQLRYSSYKAANMVPRATPTMIDDADFDPHAFVFGIYYFEELVSTIRLHHVTPEHPLSQSAEVFPDVMEAYLEAGLTIIDPCRFAVDPVVAAEIPVIPYITLRPSIVAAAYFKADRVLQPVRPAHAAFYKRVFYAETVVDRRMTEIYGRELSLLATNTHTTGDKLLRRYPFFDSGVHERRLMFGRQDKRSAFDPLTILPSARLVANGKISGAIAGLDY